MSALIDSISLMPPQAIYTTTLINQNQLLEAAAHIKTHVNAQYQRPLFSELLNKMKENYHNDVHKKAAYFELDLQILNSIQSHYSQPTLDATHKQVYHPKLKHPAILSWIQVTSQWLTTEKPSKSELPPISIPSNISKWCQQTDHTPFAIMGQLSNWIAGYSHSREGFEYYLQLFENAYKLDTPSLSQDFKQSIQDSIVLSHDFTKASTYLPKLSQNNESFLILPISFSDKHSNTPAHRVYGQIKLSDNNHYQITIFNKKSSKYIYCQRPIKYAVVTHFIIPQPNIDLAINLLTELNPFSEKIAPKSWDIYPQLNHLSNNTICDNTIKQELVTGNCGLKNLQELLEYIKPPTLPLEIHISTLFIDKYYHLVNQHQKDYLVSELIYRLNQFIKN